MIRRLSVVALLSMLCALSFAQSPRQRHFKFVYAFTVRNPDQGKPLQVWFPMAASDRWQRVRVLSAKGDLPVRQTGEEEYGDRMFYAYTPKAENGEYRFEVVYDVVRTERIGLRNGKPVGGGPQLSRIKLNRFLEPDRLVPIDGQPAAIAAEQTHEGDTILQKAREIYDYVFRTMRYDKSGTGWGRGDAVWACDAHHGNCTDFHSLFAAMARSQHIPVRFSIGFAVPADKGSGSIPGYHCWADFYADKTWIPVDISEAWQQSKKEYFFGAHDENRVQFSVGRDIELSPRQAGDPLNYFVYPYVESGGKKYENVSNGFSFEDLP
jgi:transglutaminase-like putative cysteine protease